jgi:hypothetical protein
MEKIGKKRIVTARRPHKCPWCKEMIEPGEGCFHATINVFYHVDCYFRRWGEFLSHWKPEDREMFLRTIWFGQKLKGKVLPS